MSNLGHLIEARVRRADDLLVAAVRVEVSAYFAHHLDTRIAARPHWCKRTPRIMYEEILVGRDRHIDALVPRLVTGLAAVPFPPGAADAVHAVLAPVLQDTLRELLLFTFLPGDSFPDLADDPSVDLSPTYDILYQPSAALLTAFTSARRAALAQAAWTAHPRRPLPPTLEVRLYLPEALRDDPPL